MIDSKNTMVWLCVQACLLCGLLVSFLEWRESGAACQDTLKNHQIGQRLTTEILAMRDLKTVANDQEVADMPNSRVVDIARRSGIGSRNVVAIERLEPIDIEGSDYRQRDTSIELREVTMEQVVKLMLSIESQVGVGKVTSANFSQRSGRRPASAAGSTELWNTQLILTQLDFTATSQGR